MYNTKDAKFQYEKYHVYYSTYYVTNLECPHNLYSKNQKQGNSWFARYFLATVV